MAYLDPRMQKRLTQKLEALNALRPLPPSAVQKLQKQFEIEMTYNSNAIEGNCLTLKETFLVLSEGITVRNKPLKDHLEARDHYEALEYMADLVAHDKKHTFSQQLVRTLHGLVVKDTVREEAGKYRTTEVRITGSSHRPPLALDVPHKMQDLIQRYAHQPKTHPVEQAALLHHEFVHIHPFVDGNGRTGRLIMNVLLMQHGYPLAVILKNDRAKYYRALSQSDRGDKTALVRLVAQCVERSLDIYLKTLTPQQKGSKPSKDMTLSQIAQKTKYSAKYLNLLVRQGRLEARKEGRNWVSSLEALRRYEDTRLRKR